MIVYAETNYVLELAFLRDEVEHAEALLALAEGGRVRLVLPAFSLSEPYESMTRRARERRALLDRLATEITELARSRPYASLNDTARAFTSLVAQSADEEWTRLSGVQNRLLAVAEIAPLTGETIRRGLAAGPEFGLSSQDAVVFASVETHMAAAGSEPKVFVTKNRKDFVSGDISDRLAELDCKLLTRFADAHGYVQSVLDRAT
ncbi:MAG: hypothetical protein ICV87_04875 [Gemmatimonadetes bacterium]|nr:hypothetical protein [Gemmatimonadota bacterium]